MLSDTKTIGPHKQRRNNGWEGSREAAKVSGAMNRTCRAVVVEGCFSRSDAAPWRGQDSEGTSYVNRAADLNRKSFSTARRGVQGRRVAGHTRHEPRRDVTSSSVRRAAPLQLLFLVLAASIHYAHLCGCMCDRESSCLPYKQPTLAYMIPTTLSFVPQNTMSLEFVQLNTEK